MKRSFTLLYAEDDDDTRVIMSEVLQQSVDKLYVAKDGSEALEIFKEHCIDFVISDFHMPKMNGNELCSAIKEINPDVYFVLLTAYNDTKLLTDAINAGVDEFLLKPVEGEKLFFVIDKIKEKINQKFNLDRACAYLHDAEKIANLFYWDCNLSAKTMYFQKEAIELFDLPTELKNKLDYQTFSTMVLEEEREKFLYIFEKKIFHEERVDEVVVIQNQNHEHRYRRIATSRWKSSPNGDTYIIGLFQDISRYEQQRLALLKESHLDPMLNIDNKKFLLFELSNLIKSSIRYGVAIAVLFFDIDNFKRVNDEHGHMVADEILVELVDLIKNNIRQSDYLGRWGGDEFVLVTAYSSPDSDMLLAQKILDKVKNHTWLKNIELSVSVGLAFYKLGDDANSLIQKADFKMLEAKRAGKNRYRK